MSDTMTLPPQISIVSVMCGACGKSTMGGAWVRQDGFQTGTIPPDKCAHCGQRFPERPESEGR